MKKQILLLLALISVALCHAQVRSYYSPEELDKSDCVFSPAPLYGKSIVTVI